jgi:predicted nucleic acid-binding protein
MTRDEILAMPAGRKMDALVAENVMGLDLFTPVTDPYFTSQGIYQQVNHIESYSADIAAAWEVVEKMVNGKWRVNIENDINGRKWGCDFKDDPLHTTLCVADSLTLAICRAALLAVMENNGQFPA